MQVVLIILQAQGGNRHRSVEHTFQFIRVLRLVLPTWLAALAVLVLLTHTPSLSCLSCWICQWAAVLLGACSCTAWVLGRSSCRLQQAASGCKTSGRHLLCDICLQLGTPFGSTWLPQPHVWALALS